MLSIYKAMSHIVILVVVNTTDDATGWVHSSYGWTLLWRAICSLPGFKSLLLAWWVHVIAAVEFGLLYWAHFLINGSLIKVGRLCKLVALFVHFLGRPRQVCIPGLILEHADAGWLHASFLLSSIDNGRLIDIMAVNKRIVSWLSMRNVFVDSATILVESRARVGQRTLSASWRIHLCCEIFISEK